MQSDKISYNNLLFQHNRSVAKLNRLLEKGFNIRKQDILKRRIKKNYHKLISLISAFKKTVALGAIIGGSLVLKNNQLNAQSFLPAVVNPFSISAPETSFYTSCSFADLDGDSDLDMMAVDYYSNFIYLENIGNINTPIFDTLVLNPFSLQGSYNSYDIYNLKHSFVDIDGDGDFDIMAGSRYNKFYFYKNIGDTTNPIFSQPIENPFGLYDYGYLSRTASFSDLDNDGDFDLTSGSEFFGLLYFENGGTSTDPAFSFSGYNLFNITVPTYYYSNASPSYGDLDSDGDLDLISSYGNGGAYFGYYKNYENDSVPDFQVLQINPFSLGLGEYLINASPTFIDLDGDGDLDVMSGSGWNSKFFYYENTECNADAIFVTQDDGILTVAEITDAAYQWVDCSTSLAIEGEIGLTFSPSVTGDYAVEISLGNCTNTSLCNTVYVCDSSDLDVIINQNQGVLLLEYTVDIEITSSLQWFDCDSLNLPIANENENEYVPLESGSYGLSGYFDGCFVTTECFDFTYVGIEENLIYNKIQFYPNPVHNNLYLNFENPLQNALIEVKSLTGQVIYNQKNAVGKIFTLNFTNEAKGFYLLQIIENGYTSRAKFVKD